MENLLVPYQAVTEIPCSKAVVLAPHPDDEIFGCGGAILRHLARGNPVRVIVVSDGAYGLEGAARAAHTLLRQQESQAAASVLGYGVPEFWGMRDRELAYGEKLVRRIVACLEDTDLVYAPSVFEMHPDHRALGMAAVEAVRRCGKGVRLALYEVGMPLRPNLLLDISDLMARKQAAMACFVSQNAIQRYDLDIAALNRYRTYTLPDSVTAAEAYILTGAEELASDPFRLYQSEHERQRELGLRLDGRDAPLVSIIIRSMDRSTLKEALDSVALQTYPNIEVVLVNAKGTGHREMGDWCGRFPLSAVSTGQPLSRSRAANLGLDAARGEYLIFLDDDDWFAPEHIAKLAEKLSGAPEIKACYSGVQCADADGNLSDLVYNSPYDPDRLLLENYIPIHSVLFASQLVKENNCQIDETLDVYEDWDFWLQLSRHTRFGTIENVSAYYRGGGGDSGSSVHEQAVRDASLPRIYDKWKALWTGVNIWRAVKGFNRKIVDTYQPHIQHLDRVIENLEQVVQAKDQAIQDRDRIIQDRDRIIHDQNQAIQDRDRIIQDRDRIIHDQNQAIQEKWQLIHQCETKLEEAHAFFDQYARRQSANLKSLLVKNDGLKERLTQEHARVAGLLRQEELGRVESIRLAAAVGELEQKLQVLLASRSWRITAPLRGLTQLLRGVGQPPVSSVITGVSPVAEKNEGEAEKPAFSLVEHVNCPEFREYLACFRPCDDLTDEVRWAMRAQIDAMKSRPEIGVRFSLLGLSDEQFQRAFDAIRYQLYPRWELWVVDGEFAREVQKTHIREAAAQDSRIHFALESSESITQAVSPDAPIESDYTYVLGEGHIPPELAFYRLAFFLIRHNLPELGGDTPEDRFTRWLERYEAAAMAEIRRLKSSGAALSRTPLISVVMPVYNTSEKWLRQAINSVCSQYYANWELCIVDDCSTEPGVRTILDEYGAKDARIRVIYSEVNRGVAAASNVAIRAARGEFVVLMDHDDVIEKLALQRVAASIVADAPDMLYSDEAVVDESGGKVLGLVFRPGFSREFLRAHPYIVHLAGFRRDFLLELGGFDETLAISHDYDLMLRAAENACAIVHIPEVLYRWRTHAGSAGHEKMSKVTEISQEILARHLARSGEDARVETAKFFNYYDIRYPLHETLKVAIIIPTKNHGELVRQCIESIVRTVKHLAYDIVLINHDSNDPDSLAYFHELATRQQVLNYSGPFNFSTINNFAIQQLDRGYTHYLFCNNDIEAIHDGWLERMVELGQQTDVGVVGARLLYPDRQMVQHAGVIIGMNGIAGHAGQFMGATGVDGNPEKGYLGRLIATHEQMAVTAACMLVRRDAFERVRGYDEELAVGFGDTDLSLRIFQAGYRVLYCPHAELLHHESYTRGKSTHDPHPEDSARFKKKWQTLLENGDFYYNPNLSSTCSWWDIGEFPGAGINAKRRVWRKAGKSSSAARFEWH